MWETLGDMTNLSSWIVVSVLLTICIYWKMDKCYQRNKNLIADCNATVALHGAQLTLREVEKNSSRTAVSTLFNTYWMRVN